MKNFDLFLSSFVFLFAFTCAETHHDSGLHNQSDLKAEASTYVDQVNIDVPKALQEDLTSNITQQIYQRSLNIQTNSRWKDRLNSIVQVPYYIDPNYFTVDQINTIENAILTLSNEAKVVKFIPRTNQAAYINIVDTTGGCSSFVGKSPTGKSQDLNLSTDGCLIPGIIQHELLHAIGFFHEQSRPDRDSYVRINLSNVNPKNRHNFDIASGSSLLDSEYDYSSLMHYEKYDFAIDASVETIIPLQSGVSALGQREGLTSDDIAKIHLLYQCISGPRNLESYKNDPCTVDCPCWEGATGCNGVDAACRTGLICSNNQCVIGTSTGGGGVGTTDESCTDVPGWIDAEGDGCIWYEENNGCLLNGNFPGSDLFGKTANEACCICGGGSFSGGVTYLELRNDAIPSDCLDLYGASTTNGNPIILYPCNGSPAQKWFVDGNYYIRSALDTNKCIVGSAGETSEGTNLVINDCFANDTRFVLGYYDDKTFRPAIDTYLCVEPSYSETFDGWYVVQLSVCSDNASQQWTPYRASERRDLLTEDSNRSRDLQDECTDLPNAWYDIYGDNCAWYAAGTNCKDYGSQNKNFGKTANQACCVCGGGSSAERDMGDQQSAPVGVALNDAGCYDFDGFYDNVGDGCVWYAQGYNCEYYGSQFASERGTANEACCACGGGSPDPPALSDETLTPGCSNNPSNWVDKDGDNCAFYAIGSNCDDFGDDNFGVATKTARSACCACGGGISPNTQGTSDGIDSTITTTDETSAAPVSSTLPVYLSVSCLVFLFLFRFHLPIMG